MCRKLQYESSMFKQCKESHFGQFSQLCKNAFARRLCFRLSLTCFVGMIIVARMCDLQFASATFSNAYTILLLAGESTHYYRTPFCFRIPVASLRTDFEEIRKVTNKWLFLRPLGKKTKKWLLQATLRNGHFWKWLKHDSKNCFSLHNHGGTPPWLPRECNFESFLVTFRDVNFEGSLAKVTF